MDSLNGVPFFYNLKYFQDKTLGWTGKQIFGDFETDKKRIFILGDSFTDGVGVSEDGMYYSSLKEKLNSELFIYAGDGYGNYQEYLVLEKYMEQIKPDLIILQLTSNDFINNNYELQKNDIYNYQLDPRPYLLNGKHELLYNSSIEKMLYTLSSNYRLPMRLTYKYFIFRVNLSSKLDKYLKIIRNKQQTSDKSIYSSNFYKSVKTTKTIFDNIFSLAGDTPVVFLLADFEEPSLTIFKSLIENKAHLVTEASEEINKEIYNNNDVLIDGVHWNNLGHRIVGQILFDKLIDFKIIPDIIPYNDKFKNIDLTNDIKDTRIYSNL